MAPSRLDRTGVGFALACYLSWGMVPLYWRQLRQVPAPEVLAHRVVWSALLFLLVVLLKPSARRAFGQVLLKRRGWGAFFASAALISANWGIYIHAVTSGQVLESALGYFINPLVNVLLGRLFLGEKLSTLRKGAVALALLGVGQMALGAGHFPWIALSLALSFGLYGLVRKRNPVDAWVASSLEAALLVPLAMGFLFWPLGGRAWGAGMGLFSRSGAEFTLLLLGGGVTAFPLYWFVRAAQRLPLSALGFFQYLSPSVQFLIAIWFFHEPFAPEIARGFALVWLALGIFVFELLRGSRRWRVASAGMP